MSPIETTKKYVDLENSGDLDAVAKLFAEEATYSSSNLGIFFGISSIMEMKRSFFAGLSEFHWQVPGYEEIKPGVVEFSFSFAGRSASGEEIKREGEEIVVVNSRGQIQHVQV